MSFYTQFNFNMADLPIEIRQIVAYMGILLGVLLLLARFKRWEFAYTYLGKSFGKATSLYLILVGILCILYGTYTAYSLPKEIGLENQKYAGVWVSNVGEWQYALKIDTNGSAYYNEYSEKSMEGRQIKFGSLSISGDKLTVRAISTPRTIEFNIDRSPEKEQVTEDSTVISMTLDGIRFVKQ